jgi:uncharacterized membrane protein YkoI
MLRRTNSPLVAATICTALIVGDIRAGQALAGEKSHDAVRQAVERGEIQSLSSILTAVREKLPGEVTAIEVEKKKDRWIYEFRVVDKNGRLFEVYVDARSAEIIQTKEK